MYCRARSTPIISAIREHVMVMGGYGVCMVGRFMGNGLLSIGSRGLLVGGRIKMHCPALNVTVLEKKRKYTGDHCHLAVCSKQNIMHDMMNEEKIINNNLKKIK